MKLDILQVINDQKKCYKKEISFALISFIIFTSFIIFLLPDDQKFFALTSFYILIVAIVYNSIKSFIYYCHFKKQPNKEL